MMTPDEMIAVLQAHKEGKEVQFASLNKEDWATVPSPTWRFHDARYRVKPEPKKPREFWVCFDIGNDSPLPDDVAAEFPAQWRGEVVHVREVLPNEEAE